MKANAENLLKFLKDSHQFAVPIYQRTYSWDAQQCEQLWEDILRTGGHDNIPAHFVGSIVYIEQSHFQVSNLPPLLVIDGQQRLTTVTLLLEALARKLEDLKPNEPIDGFSAEKVRNYYLLNSLEHGEKKYKLILTQTDKNSLISLLRQEGWPRELSIRIKENFEFFVEKIASLGNDLTILCRGLAKLVIVDVALDRHQDNPQLIFESMNSTGKELSQADLIRNFVLMRLPNEEQERLYTRYWRPMETAFGQKNYEGHFDKFMRHYLTIKTKEIPNINRVYEAFKVHAQLNIDHDGNVESLLKDVHVFAKYYCSLALNQEVNKELEEVFSDLREFKVDVAYPFLLELYSDYDEGSLSQEDFVQAARLVESYVFRRAVCNVPTNSLNQTFATATRSFSKENYLENISTYFATLPSYRRFPGDEEFMRDFKSRDLYNFARRSYWLRRIENYGKKERVPVNDYTIEHIMPQNENLSSEWRSALGPDWERVHQTWLHTLGNLTLTGYNSEYSDHAFEQKRDMDGGFRDSPLTLNKGLGTVEAWDEDAIKSRADKLCELAIKVWSKPEISESASQNSMTRKAKVRYSIKDHEYLSPTAPMRVVFESLRKEILALDSVVIEEFYKPYVAYKAETNFVDVEPQARSLKLSLNMPFHEINDPKGICRDVTNIGHLGNGDVEVRVSSAEEIPYVIGLIRQAFENQMTLEES